MLESKDGGFPGLIIGVCGRVVLWNRGGTNCGDGGFREAAAVAVAEWVVETGRIIGVAGA